uniref:Zing finger transcription factor PEI1 n=1 Tax=Boechera stricta TaxID=72658 RepID=Q6WEQ1_BOEST|nr:zing finger transcription factor PEI1 [Boechera stricta]
MLKSASPLAFYDIGDQQYSTLGYIVSKPGIAEAYDLDHPIPTINNAIYGSDEFRMYAYKIKRCPRTRSHDWTECPYAHRGEKATRRDPRRYTYCAVACPAFRNGACHRGDSCEFAHGVFEYWLHPARYRTRACNAGNMCQRKVCFFAHAPEQLRQSEGKHRCRYAYRPVRARGGNGDGVAMRLDGEDYDTSRSPEKSGKGDLDSNEEKVLLKCWTSMTIVDDHYQPSDLDLDLDLSHIDWISELVD